jgi:hypothetical protein
VCGVERVRKSEPSTERFVIGRFDVYVVSFERYKSPKINKKSEHSTYTERRRKILRARSYISGMSYCGKKGRLRLCIKRSLRQRQRRASHDQENNS